MKSIVAVDKNWAIGCKGRLLTYIPDDLKFFKNMTINKVVIMGRKTYDSLPNSSKPLPNRINIVLTGNKEYKLDNAEVFTNIDDLFRFIKKFDSNDIFIIGGESIYKQFLPYVDECYVTKINYEFEADTYYPNLDINNEFILSDTSDEQTYFDITYTWNKYKRKI